MITSVKPVDKIKTVTIDSSHGGGENLKAYPKQIILLLLNPHAQSRACARRPSRSA